MPPPKIVIEPRPTEDIPGPEESAGRSKHKNLWRAASLLFVASLAWGVWAAGAFYDFRSGLQDADPVALERRIDWNSVRQGLRDDLQAGPVSPAGGGAASNASSGATASPGSARPDQTIDALLSRQAVINLLRTARLDARGWETSAPTHPESARERVFASSRIRYAFFSGSPFAFRVDISPDSDTVKRPLILLFRWLGDWRLTRVFLPGDVNILAASRPPPRAVSSVAAPAQPLPTGAQRAVLFEEDPGDPKGKRYTGSVVWRTEELPPAGGGASQLAVAAHAAIPDRPLSVTMTIRPNLDKSLPATHTIEVRFDMPSNYATGGIKDMLGIMMKPTDETAGQQLAGSRVKVNSDFFLIGLSAIELEVQRNLVALKTQPWFGIPFVYNNGSRAVLAIEKGPAGNKIIAEAFARWSKTSLTESADPKR